MPAAITQLKSFVPSVPSSRAAEPGFFARLVQRIQEARLRQAEREIGLFISAKGGRLTDDLERQIEHHFTSGR